MTQFLRWIYVQCLTKNSDGSSCVIEIVSEKHSMCDGAKYLLFNVNKTFLLKFTLKLIQNKKGLKICGVLFLQMAAEEKTPKVVNLENFWALLIL